MKVVLLEDVKSLGKKGQTVEVSDGYARNCILPKKLGVEANAVNLNKEAKIYLYTPSIATKLLRIVVALGRFNKKSVTIKLVGHAHLDRICITNHLVRQFRVFF